ncbi:MAG: adenosine kinase [Nanoarchaeota archaeon]
MSTIFGIGNPLLDSVVHIQDDVLVNFGFKKGSMHLVNEADFNKIQGFFPQAIITRQAAGSCANTMMGLARLGTRAIFCGNVGSDTDGTTYEESIRATGVFPLLGREGRTGGVISLVSPDTERTMATHLGAALLFQANEQHKKAISMADIVYLTGYVLDDPHLRKEAILLIEHAKKLGKKVAFDCADASLIQRNKDLIRLVITSFADITFMNETEAQALTGRNPEEALNLLKKEGQIVIVKTGESGSLISDGTEIIRVPVVKVDAVDTTGAGDMYAAGFLHGLVKGYPLEKCGHLGSYVAAQIVKQVSAYPPDLSHAESIILG